MRLLRPPQSTTPPMREVRYAGSKGQLQTDVSVVLTLSYTVSRRRASRRSRMCPQRSLPAVCSRGTLDSMLQPFLGNKDARWAETWQELGEGAPTLASFARLCSLALAGAAQPDRPLSPEAKAILYAARERGMIEVKGANRAFEAPARLLAVHVETGPQQTLIFRNRDKPEVTIRFLAGFRELCEAGLAMHHIYGDF